jgi:hypothetical protein
MRLAFLFTVLPALALAQTSTGLTLEVQGQSSQTVSGSACGDTTQLTWTVALTGAAACSNLVIWASTSSCGDAPDDGDFQIADIPPATWSSQTTGTETLAISDLPLSTGDGGSCGAAVEVTVNLCAALKYAGYSCDFNSQTIHASPDVTIDYDAVAPDVPILSAVDGFDHALRVGLTIDSDATRVVVQYRPQGSEAWLPGGELSATEASLTIDGLENGVTYEVRAKASDAAGNPSAYSAIKSGTPQETAGFWAAYKGSGGDEMGGCAAGGAGGLLAGVLVLLGLLWRKR